MISVSEFPSLTSELRQSREVTSLSKQSHSIPAEFLDILLWEDLKHDLHFNSVIPSIRPELYLR